MSTRGPDAGPPRFGSRFRSWKCDSGDAAAAPGAPAARTCQGECQYPTEGVGILDPFALAPEIDRSALVGTRIAKQLLSFDGNPSRIYVRADTARVVAVAALLAPTANPEAPDE